jgi:aminopeptidase N
MRRSLAVLLIVLTGSGLALRAQAPVAEPLRTAADRPFDIKHIRLDLKVDLPKKTVDATARLDVRSLRAIGSIALDAVDFEVKKVKLADRELTFNHDGKRLEIDLEPAWPADKDGTLVIDYRVREPRAGLYFFGPSEAEPDVPLTVWSQGEPTTNRYWIPCIDEPVQKQTTELVVTVADGFEVLSNGSLVGKKPNASDKTVTYHWKQDQPHASYLVTLVVGQFDVVEEKWQNKPVVYYVPKGHKEEVARTFGRTREMLDVFSRKFGIQYPWDKYAQVVVEQFNAGGMENTSATTLTDRALHDERSLLDGDSDGLISHELGHQWWGDLVTCRDWAHLWLNEGFASYCELVWAEHKSGPDEYAYDLMGKGRNAIAGGKQRPIVDRRYPGPGSMFDARAYPKGAFVLHMLRKRLGDDAFWKGLKEYGTEHRLQSVETADFRRTMERVSGRSLERFFYDWTERPGNPTLEISSEYQPESKQVRVTVKQTQAGEPFEFPLKLVVHGPDAKSASTASKPQEVVENVTEKEHSFIVSAADRPSLVEVDPEQAVLAEFKETKSREQWLAQLSRGTGVVSRVRAAQHLAQSKLPADREALAKALPEERFYGVQIEIANALAEAGGDSSRTALVAELKNGNAKVRRACVNGLGQFAKDDKAAAALKDLLAKGDPSYAVEAASLTAYAKLHRPDAVAVLLPWLAKPSYNHVLTSAALNGLGNSQDLSATDTLISWTKKGKPRSTRAAALAGLAQLSKGANPSEEQRGKMVAAVVACLEGEGSAVRRSAVAAVREFGRAGTPALGALDALHLHDPDDRIRDLARASAEQIRKNEPVPVELTRLREELEAVRKSQNALRERLQKFEKVERKGEGSH